MNPKLYSGQAKVNNPIFDSKVNIPISDEIMRNY